MGMKQQLAGLLLGIAAMDVSNNYPSRFNNRNILKNGNYKRSHKQNVRRRRLRRLIKKSKQINRLK